MPGPLAGIRIVDLSQMVSGPLCTMLLADQGADVIKVEQPRTGDLTRHLGPQRGSMSSIFLTTNRNKRSIVIGLKSAAGRALLERLIATADVLVQNFRPGVIERMGFGEAEVRARHPRLVYVSISGFGERGPYAQKPVYDPIIQALSGLAAIQADRDTGRPRMVRTIIPDKVTALTAAQAVTAALFARERSGEGQHVRLAMLDATVALIWPEGMVTKTLIGDGVSEPRPGSTADLIYPTRDGFITASTISDKEWAGMCRAIERPDLLEDPRFATPAARVSNADERIDLIATLLAENTSSHWLERLESEDVPCAPILSRDQLLEHEQVLANELLAESDHPQAGRMRQPRPAARFAATPAALRSPAPALGEHTDEVMAELGVEAAERQALRDRGVVA